MISIASKPIAGFISLLLLTACTYSQRESSRVARVSLAISCELCEGIDTSPLLGKYTALVVLRSGEYIEVVYPLGRSGSIVRRYAVGADGQIEDFKSTYRYADYVSIHNTQIRYSANLSDYQFEQLVKQSVENTGEADLPGLKVALEQRFVEDYKSGVWIEADDANGSN